MIKKQTYTFMIKTDKKIDLNKLDEAIKMLDQDYELIRLKQKYGG